MLSQLRWNNTHYLTVDSLINLTARTCVTVTRFKEGELQNKTTKQEVKRLD